MPAGQPLTVVMLAGEVRNALPTDTEWPVHPETQPTQCKTCFNTHTHICINILYIYIILIHSGFLVGIFAYTYIGTNSVHCLIIWYKSKYMS